MYKRDNITIIILMVLMLIFSIIFKADINNDVVANLLTFTTVYLGFILTSFVIMADNIEIKKLNMKKDPEDNYLMLNYRLLNYFKYTFKFGFTIIGILLMTTVFHCELISNYITNNVTLSLVVGMLYSSLTPNKILCDIFLNKIVE